MSDQNLTASSISDFTDAAYESLTYGISLLSLLVLEDSITRLKKSGIPPPEVLNPMREALLNATVITKKEILESAYSDITSFWWKMCEFAKQAGFVQKEVSGKVSFESPLILSEKRAMSLLTLLKCIEALRKEMSQAAGNSDKLAGISKIISEGNSALLHLPLPVDRASALENIDIAVTKAFDDLSDK